ncbi:GAF domain-containing protein [Haladaptatus pallidirubidus]|uniref:PAS domain S-box-containing protein n=1 Tax=Haladaptatus pallidirubidus TaxID=1008152 RepID=A0AAV3UP08_9EURY|nr:GAF domain-containing protein [Haladaptatus pallidirubidus]
MSSPAPSPTTVLDVFDTLGPPGTPFTTPEVAEEFDCTDRTIYNKLDTLVEDDILETKKVGARGRVWWRPPKERSSDGTTAEAAATEATFRELFENVPGLYLIVKPDDYEIVAVSDAYLEATMTKRAEIIGKTLFEVFPPDPSDPDPEGVPRLRASLERVKAEREADVMPVTYYPIPRRNFQGGGFEDRWWSPTNSPVFSSTGEIDFIIHRVEDVTPVVRQFQADGKEELLQELDATDSHLAADIILRGDELQQAKERAYDRLRESKARLDAFVTATSEVIFRMNPDWTEMNELEGQEFMADTDKSRSNWIDEYIPSDEQGRVQDAIDEAIKTKSTFELEHQVLQVDGTRGWTHSRAVPILDDDGKITEWFGTASDITERKQAEAELEAELSATRELQEISTELIGEDNIETLSDRVLDAAIAIMDTDFASVQLYDPDRNDLELVAHRGFNGEAESAWQRVTPEHGSTCGKALRTGERVIAPDVETCEFIAGTEDLETYRQTGIRAVQTTPLVSRSGDVLGMFSTHWETPRDLSEFDLGRLDILARQAADLIEHQQTTEALREREEQLRQANESLKRLNAASRELIDADTERVTDHVAEVTQNVLDVEYTALWRYDEAAGEIREYSSHMDLEPEAGSVRVPDGLSKEVWQTFVANDVDVDNDLNGSESGVSESPLRSRALMPLGRHGVICAGSTQTDAFDDQTVHLAETVAATVETAWNRANGEAELARQNEELTRLDRLNTLIRDIDQVLVEAKTVDAIDEAVCEQLANSALFEFAWIGEFDADDNAMEPRAWAGVDSSYLDELTTEVDELVAERSPFIAAIQTGEMQVVADIATDARATPWREVTLKRGARSCLSIPLMYDESVYGVLTVYEGTLQDIERDADRLAELGETIAHAIHAIETRETLQTDSSVELTLRSTAAETPLCRLAREIGCVIEFEGLVPGADGDTTVFFTATGISPDEFVAVGEQSFAIEELHCLANREKKALFKAQLADPTLASQFLDRDATVQTLTIDAGTATAIINLPETAAVREFIKGVQQAVPDLELLSRRALTRALETELTFLAMFEDRLTSRQQEILQFAYRSGFFESPRVQTGNELSEALDISQSTFTQHLREAQRRLCVMVFDNS